MSHLSSWFWQTLHKKHPPGILSFRGDLAEPDSEVKTWECHCDSLMALQSGITGSTHGQNEAIPVLTSSRYMDSPRRWNAGLFQVSMSCKKRACSIDSVSCLSQTRSCCAREGRKYGLKQMSFFLPDVLWATVSSEKKELDNNWDTSRKTDIDQIFLVFEVTRLQILYIVFHWVCRHGRTATEVLRCTDVIHKPEKDTGSMTWRQENNTWSRQTTVAITTSNPLSVSVSWSCRQ